MNTFEAVPSWPRPVGLPDRLLAETLDFRWFVPVGSLTGDPDRSTLGRSFCRWRTQGQHDRPQLPTRSLVQALQNPWDR